MDEEQKKAMWAIYAWCRRTDDLVDAPSAMMMPPEQLTAVLYDWRIRLRNIWNGVPRDSIDLALVDTLERYPELDITPFNEMIDGMLMDTPQFGQTRYETWDELYMYCYRVASTVGLMTMPVIGTAEGFTAEQASKPAVALGIGLQITNILRDVGEDARRGRIYLPAEDMKRFGVTEKQILEGRLDDNYVRLMKFEIQRAQDYYQESQEGIPMLAPEGRLAVQAAKELYGGILDKISNNKYDNFDKRAYVNNVEKLGKVFMSWIMTSQMNFKTAQ
jgi:phytoene synthase